MKQIMPIISEKNLERVLVNVIMPQKSWFLWIPVCLSSVNELLYKQQLKRQMINPREFSSLWDTKFTGNVSCPTVADYLVAISWQSRISEPLRSGADGECTGGFRSQNEVTGKCPLFSVNSGSLCWALCTPTTLWKQAVFSFLTDFKPHLLMHYPGVSSQRWEPPLITEYSRVYCSWPLANFPQRKWE